MNKKLFFYFLGSLVFFFSISYASTEEKNNTQGSDYKKWTTANHKKMPLLQKEFKSPEEVTKVCLSCHTDAAMQVQKTIHWTWKCDADTTGKMGKNGLTLNNF
ncbi:MAG: hypothetical protein CSA18_02445 [Deltaproteobacteria bacterium]|nr:MAG: hypothetical protein CSB21_01020 [Deltaproteobacteria bacterium]PIE74987.1 MAG: hypothetical protein CSA18_02445 [Deltaproteobacteria bacterium]